MTAVPAIDVRGIRFSYNGRAVLEDVNLALAPGEFTALIGPNGGGKTTLLKLLLGLLPPDSGTIRILGKKPREAVGRIGYVPQETGINKSFPVSVTDVVLMGSLKPGSRWRWYSRADRTAAERVLAQTDMSAFGRSRIGELSGGQRQRVFMARALISDPEVLLLDEPTASVDAVHQTQFYDLLKELNQKMTILLVNHDLMVISTYVKSVACVNRFIHYHSGAEITDEMVRMYHCPVELIAHGIPHRVLKTHRD